MTKREVLDSRLGDWEHAYRTVAASLTPPALVAMRDALTAAPLDENDIAGKVAQLNASLGFARLVSANDRAAATVAALIVGQGIKPTSFDYGDDT